MSNVLNITPENKIEEWSEVISELLTKGEDVYIVGDTETTGTNELGDKKNFGKKDRILEIGFLFFKSCKDEILKPLVDMSGSQIFFHEYVNPFKEDHVVLERYNSIDFIPDEVIKFVHGIDMDFLNKKSGLVMKNGKRGNFVLEKPAPTFGQVKPYIEKLLNTDNLINLKGKIHFIAHNALFDVQFMNAEWKKTEMYEEKRQFPAFFESYIHTIDTQLIAQSLYTRDELKEHSVKNGLENAGSFKLDFLQEFYGVVAEREMHGALLDSKILADVYRAMILDSRYQKSPVISRMKLGNSEITRKTRNNLISL